MDTCCIDKTSTGDTQEAINAMFRWYKEADICYAYLRDFSHPANRDADETFELDNSQYDSFVSAHWFTRSWTLQEFLAPERLSFVDQDWREFGTKDDSGLWWPINQATGIFSWGLDAQSTLEMCSIAMKFSWAAKRRVTVPEDEAYSLIGLFGISLPLIYGEGGRRAFQRLQEELIRQYDDETILAWEYPLTGK
jgi:hypothetical protein